MKEEYISTGKNVDIAIKNGLMEIGKTREDVDIKIVETGGLFKKAKVILIYEKENENVVNSNVENAEVDIDNSKEFDKDSSNSLLENEIALSENNEKNENTTEEKVDDSLVQETENDIEEKLFESKNSISEIQENKIIDKTALKIRITEFLNGLLNKFNIKGQIDSTEENNELKFVIKGENVGKLIGYRGETLNAIQYILGSLKEHGESKIRIYLDIEGYKEKREETLIELANKMADKAEEIERNVHLDPMTPYERRIIHTALQSRTLVETESTGEGEKRHVVIKFKR